MNWRHPNLPSSLRHHWDDGHLEEATDLILMDIQMPVLDAYDATRHIKVDPNLESDTRNRGEFICHKGRRAKKPRAAEFDCCVKKPYSPTPLLRIIRQFLSEQG